MLMYFIKGCKWKRYKQIEKIHIQRQACEIFSGEKHFTKRLKIVTVCSDPRVGHPASF